MAWGVLRSDMMQGWKPTKRGQTSERMNKFVQLGLNLFIIPSLECGCTGPSPSCRLKTERLKKEKGSRKKGREKRKRKKEKERGKEEKMRRHDTVRCQKGGFGPIASELFLFLCWSLGK